MFLRLVSIFHRCCADDEQFVPKILHFVLVRQFQRKCQLRSRSRRGTVGKGLPDVEQRRVRLENSPDGSRLLRRNVMPLGDQARHSAFFWLCVKPQANCFVLQIPLAKIAENMVSFDRLLTCMIFAPS